MKGNQEPMLYTTNATVASLNHVPGFDPLKFLRRTISRKTGEDVMRLDLRYKKLWFRLACPTGRLKLNALRITEKMAIFEAKVYRDREDAEPLSSYVANCTLDATPGGLYVEAAQEEALDTALSNAGFGIQFADVGSESEEYGSEVPVGAKAEIAKPVQVKTVAAKPVQTKAEVTESVQKQPEAVKAAPQEIHQTYSLLLSMLPLTPTHKAHLLSPRRGLTEEQIARFGFKSTPPAFLCRSYAERLRRQGCTLQGVPGFYTDDAGRWTINFSSRTAGILLPAVGMDGLICGMQIRLDTPLRRRDDPPGKSGAKYIWLSSIGKPHGVTSGSPLHFVGEPFAKTVYVTEGLLKADIAYCLTGRSFVAVAGVNSLNGLESALRCMAQNGTKLVVEAYDMDKLENEYVASAAEKVQQIARVAGLQSTSLVWNTAYKGIDDWQLALRQEEAKEKAA